MFGSHQVAPHTEPGKAERVGVRRGTGGAEEGSVLRRG